MERHNFGYGYPYPSADRDSTPRYVPRAGSTSVTSSTSWQSSSGGSNDSGYTYSSESSGQYNSYRMPDSYSVSTAPSSFTALSTMQQQFNGQTTTISSPRRLGCEFKAWTGCQRSFGLEEDEIGQWIRHVEDDHLGRNYPSRCICWFCDDVEFRTELPHDPGMNFEYRMKHIADHVLEGFHFDIRRPDFHFIDHVYSIGLISPEAFALAKGQSEGPAAPAGVHPSGFRPAARQSRPEAVVYVSNSSRRRQRDTRRHA
ncbi:hypothetical protein CCHR01_16364 [Colletotrichum chrysophilum]|uniref:Uncharacterized protein n=1 Tax=Colletotrichum chrysophilum TaxID=1836956 RepID=A0AAD9EA36_9PEZI|nr:hypothetical protein CCHR01_16364 [Colletotrichum chrysophilum]